MSGLKPEREEIRNLYNGAKKRIREEMLKMNREEPLFQDLLLVVGMGIRGTSVRSNSPNTLIREALLNDGHIDAFSIMTSHGWGEFRMNQFVKESIKNPPPKDRLWVTLIRGEGEHQMGIYRLVGQGENPPKKWNGYIPKAWSEEL